MKGEIEGNEKEMIPTRLLGSVERSASWARNQFESLRKRAKQVGNKTFFTLKHIYVFLLQKWNCFLHFIFRIFFFTTKISLFSIIISFALVCLLLVGVCLLTILSTTSAATVRYLLLKDVPGNGVVSLSFNVLPLVTEWWRGDVIDKAVHLYLPSSDLPFTPEEGEDKKEERKNADARASYTVAERIRRGQANNLFSTEVSTAVLTKASDIKISLVRQYVDAIVATSTLLIPSRDRLRFHPSMQGVGFPTIFSSSGEVNPDLLFLPPTDPFFTLEAEYAGSIQLVFLKEGVGVDAMLVVDYAILYADSGGGRSGTDDTSFSSEDEWLLPNLRVLFRDTQTTHIRTGPPSRSRLRVLIRRGVERLFSIPLRVYRYLYYIALDTDNAPFPFIDSRREVSVVVPLYKRFTPPAPIRDRLRAINFTIYQAQFSQGEKKIRLSRWMFHSSIQLTGLAFYLREYPLISFVLLFFFFVVLYSVGFAIFVCVVLWKCFRGGAKESDENNWTESANENDMEHEDDEEEEDSITRTPHTDSSCSSSRSSRSNTSSAVSRRSSPRRRRSYPDSEKESEEAAAIHNDGAEKREKGTKRTVDETRGSVRERRRGKHESEEKKVQ